MGSLDRPRRLQERLELLSRLPDRRQVARASVIRGRLLDDREGALGPAEVVQGLVQDGVGAGFGDRLALGIHGREG